MRNLGRNDLQVSALGLGCSSMSSADGVANDTESVATIQAAFDAGITLLDSADFYGMGHNELLIREALRNYKREQVVLSVKFGALRDPAGGWHHSDNRPTAVKNFLAYSLKRLGTDYIDIYRPARLDTQIPIEETIGAIADMVKAGYVRQIGLSEVGAATLRRAAAVHPIADLQIEYSLISRSIETEILPTCRELGIGITAYGVLSHGLISGHWSKDRSNNRTDYRNYIPRFSGENLERNFALVEALRSIAEAKNVTIAQIAIAWVLAQGPDIVPLVGARRRERLAESLGALQVQLSVTDLAQIEQAIPIGAVAGDRYAPSLMAELDSEH